MIITIVAFRDNQSNSVAYRKFIDIDKAVEFYKNQLGKHEVRVISTRKIINSFVEKCSRCGEDSIMHEQNH